MDNWADFQPSSSTLTLRLYQPPQRRSLPFPSSEVPPDASRPLEVKGNRCTNRWKDEPKFSPVLKNIAPLGAAGQRASPDYEPIDIYDLDHARRVKRFFKWPYSPSPAKLPGHRFIHLFHTSPNSPHSPAHESMSQLY